MFFIFFAQTTTTPNVPYLDWINLGVLGLLVVGFIRGMVVPRYVLDRSEAERIKVEEELKALRARLDTEVLPQLWRTTDVLARQLDKEGK